MESILERNKRNKRGQTAQIGILIGALIFVVILVALAPTMFDGLNLANTSAPSWAGTVLPIIVAAGLVMMVWRLFR